MKSSFAVHASNSKRFPQAKFYVSQQKGWNLLLHNCIITQYVHPAKSLKKEDYTCCFAASGTKIIGSFFMIHPHSEVRFISKEIGYGVVATKFIPKGTITWAYDQLDRSFAPAAYHAMSEPYKTILTTYCYRDQAGNFVLCWDNARFVNHSFNSNCISTAYNFEIAVRDIYPDEQLTDDYGYLNCLEPFECMPEAGTNRTMVMPDDLLYCYEEWDSLLLDAFPYFGKVAQPLAALLDVPTLQKANGVANGTNTMHSILNCFYNDDERFMQKKEALLRRTPVHQHQNI